MFLLNMRESGMQMETVADGNVLPLNWVLKESFLKATRKGLVMGLNTSEIQIPKQGDPFFLRQPEEIREAII